MVVDEPAQLIEIDARREPGPPAAERGLAAAAPRSPASRRSGVMWRTSLHVGVAALAERADQARRHPQHLERIERLGLEPGGEVVLDHDQRQRGPSTVTCSATMSGMSAMPSVSSEIFSSTPSRSSSIALRISTSGASQLRSYRSSISRTSCRAVSDSCSLAELLSSSCAIRIIVRPATISGTIAIAIANSSSLVRRLSRMSPRVPCLPSAAPAPGRGSRTSTVISSKDWPQARPVPSVTPSRTVYSPGSAKACSTFSPVRRRAVAQLPDIGQRLAVRIARPRGVEQQLVVGAADEALAVAAGDRDRRRVDRDGRAVDDARAAGAGIVGHRQADLVGAGLGEAMDRLGALGRRAVAEVPLVAA